MQPPSPLIDIKEFIPSICIDLRYASTDNILGRALYKSSKCYLIEPTAIALKKAQEEAEKHSLTLKVWDGYRPLSIQWKLWHDHPDDHHVADPRKGGRHPRGTAVDVTLAIRNCPGTCNALVMPTDFDDFTPKAYRRYMGCSLESIQNRTLLEEIMEKSGFLCMPSAWWHFDLAGWENYPPLDIPIPPK